MDDRYYENHKLREVGTKRDLLFALPILLFSILTVEFYSHAGAGLAASLASIGLYLTGVVYIFPHRARCSRYCTVCMTLYIACALSMIFSDDVFGKLCVCFAMVVLLPLTLMELMPLRSGRVGTLRAVSDWWNVAVRLSFGNIGAVLYAIFHREADGTVEKRRIGSVLIGLLCAVPALIVIVPLLTSADVAFGNLLGSVTLDGRVETLKSLFYGVILFLLLFGQHFAARFACPPMRQSAGEKKGIDPMAVVSFLSVIAFVYVLYLVSQLAYFFSAFSGLLPSDFTVAQYARRGFFEMVLLCVINLAIVTVVLRKVRKTEDREPLSIRLFALFFCGFSLLLIATALSKMFLYIDSFGMTRLRILTSVFMVFLAVVFCVAALWLFFRRIAYLKVALLAAVILITLTGFADLDRVVARYNVEAYQSGELDTVDMLALANLSSDSVVPYIWELTRDENTTVSEQAYAILLDKLVEHGLAEVTFRGTRLLQASYDWRAYSMPEYEAFCLLQEHAEEIILANP